MFLYYFQLYYVIFVSKALTFKTELQDEVQHHIMYSISYRIWKQLCFRNVIFSSYSISTPLTYITNLLSWVPLAPQFSLSRPEVNSSVQHQTNLNRFFFAFFIHFFNKSKHMHVLKTDHVNITGLIKIPVFFLFTFWKFLSTKHIQLTCWLCDLPHIAPQASLKHAHVHSLWLSKYIARCHVLNIL